MEYTQIIEKLKQLDFIQEDAKADAAAKAVLGIVASSLDEENARRLTEPLPEPLTIEKLRSHQENPTPVSFEDCAAELEVQFNLQKNEARDLIHTVIDTAKEAIGSENIAAIRGSLPEDWGSAFKSD
ncbi:MAG: DUF2267 domain-containing protein [Desulfobacteraceae bacterium]|nr:MAG: DUF2267 domain-containing protein [Desulfobacteraceae bacterium]